MFKANKNERKISKSKNLQNFDLLGAAYRNSVTLIIHQIVSFCSYCNAVSLAKVAATSHCV